MTTITAQSSTTSTSTTIASMPPAVIEIDPGASGIQKWPAGVTYTACEFWAPVSFTVEDDAAWWARGIDTGPSGLWVYLEYHRNGESLFDLDVSVLAHAPAYSVEEAGGRYWD